MRQIAVLSALLVAALVGSYLTWTAEAPVEDGDKVAVYVADADDLQQVKWTGDDQIVQVEQKSDALGDYLWITSIEKVYPKAEKKEEPADDGHGHGHGHDHGDEGDEGEDAEAEEGEDTEGADATEEAEEAPEDRGTPEIKTVSFLGNDVAQTMWDNFAPLQALRELEPDPVNPVEATVFGFADPHATIEVVRGSGPLTLTVGGETYGAKDRYVQYDSRVLLVDDATLRPLQFGKTRLPERRLHPLAEQEIAKLGVRAGPRSLDFVQQNKADRAQAFWAPASQPDDEASQSAWLGKLLRLRVQQYTTAEEAGPLTPLFSFIVAGDGADAYEIGVLTDAESDEYYAKSSFNRSLVKLTKSVASDAASDLDAIFEQATSPAN